MSLRIDGTSLSGYFFALILLQVIVTASFVLPALELGRLHMRGEDIFTPNTPNTKTFLSFWSIEWAVFGVFVYSFITLLDRIPRRDITPRYFINTSIRYIFAIALSSLFYLVYYQFFYDSNLQNDKVTFGALAALSFTIGMFPNTYFRLLISIIRRRTGTPFSIDISLENFPGLSPNEITRLWEEGIENIDQLGDNTVEELFRRTRFGPTRLKSLIGRAILLKYVFGLSKKYVNTNDKDDKIDLEVRKKIDSFPFSDIQSLCSFLFGMPLMDVKTEDDVKKIISRPQFVQNIESIKSKVDDPSILYQISYMVLDFNKRLKFTETEAGIEELLKEELNENV